MNTVRRLPGRACDYYIQGRCLYEERLNPGLDTSSRCRAILAWERHYEGFLDRAEAFSLDAVQAGRLWPRQFQRRIEAGVECPDFVPAENAEEPLPGCAHQAGELCLLKLPVCRGMCGHFVSTSHNENGFEEL